jgi:iron-sulfur cluster repair protein YtfE (RIC family)
MAAQVSDPVRRFEHSHARLTKLTLEVREAIQAERAGNSRHREQLVRSLETLRDELLEHFANEEEGLFPFLRSCVPAKAEAVDRLESAHDSVCGSVLRLVHLATRVHRSPRADRRALLDHFERFEAAYGAHSRDEAALFDEIGRVLDERQRTELASILRGL